MMKPVDLIDRSGVALPPLLRTAFVKTLEAWLPPMRHLPVPVRFRASGALRAWVAALDGLPHTSEARHALADPATSPDTARRRLMASLGPHICISARDEEVATPLVGTLLTLSSDMLAFWLRAGALYEPTLPLGGLLGGVDMSQELPMQLLRPATSTLCIVPPWQQRHQCANAGAIMLFAHGAPPEQAPAVRAITFLVMRPNADGLMTEQLTVPVKDENATLAASLTRAAEATRQDLASVGLEGENMDALVSEWKVVLDYTVKVLLYLSLDNAAVRTHCPLATAPKEWPGLGRRKREARLAEVEQLYDRYIIGPASIAEWADEHAGELGAQGQLSAHWRRGHFRLQAHGPHASLRKVMFIMPTIVRADRLAAA